MIQEQAAILETTQAYVGTPDYELTLACQQGDKAAFQKLVKQYQEKVRGLVYSILNDPELIDDLTQEIFIKVYTSIERFEHRSSLSTWIYRIAVNHCRDEIRRKRIRRWFSLEKMELDPIAVGERTDGKMLQTERIDLVRWGLSKVSENHRSIIVLKDFENLSYEEIAKILDLELGTVKSRLNRARLALKEVLEPYWSFDNDDDNE